MERQKKWKDGGGDKRHPGGRRQILTNGKESTTCALNGANASNVREGDDA
jgi:hypothetical protein